MPVVPYHDPDQNIITLDRVDNPYLSLWWSTQTISNIPDEAVGWLVAQGWEITAMSYDGTTVPPTPRYVMSKQAMQSWQVLLSLCNSYTTSANEARYANEVRYNEIVDNWNKLVESTHFHFLAQHNQQYSDNLNYNLYLNNHMRDVDQLIDANQTQILLDAYTASQPLDKLDDKIEELETNAVSNATTISDLLTAQSTYLTSFLTDFSLALDALDTNYATHLTDIETLLTASGTDLAAHATPYAGDITSLTDDYLIHSVMAPGYLTDLGATELARINKEFVASESAQLQMLVDNGLYTSAVGADIAARNTRDRSERITQLNDDLNRRKLDNQHRLYEQQTTMRARVMEGRDRLHQTQQGVTQWQSGQRDRLLEQIQQVESQQLAGIDKQYMSQQEVSRTEMAERDVLFGQLQNAVQAVAAGKERYSNTLLQQASTLAEHKHRAIAEKLNEYTIRLQGLRTVAEDTIRMMQYQLEERNKLIIGLYSFVERREDEAPEWKDIAQVIAGLGDSGGGWLTP